MTVKRTTRQTDTLHVSERIEEQQNFHIFQHEARRLTIHFASREDYTVFSAVEWAVFEDFRQAPLVRKSYVYIDPKKNFAEVAIVAGDIPDDMHGDYYYELSISDENEEDPVVAAAGILTVGGRAVKS